MRRLVATFVLTAAVGFAASPALAAYVTDGQSPNETYAYRDYGLPTRVSPSRDYVQGAAALKAKQYKSAIRHLARVTDAQPTNLTAWRALGAAYAGDGRWDASRRAYKKAVWLAPDEIVSHAGLGLALKALHDPKAQIQAEWLRARMDACHDACPDAALLKTLETRGPFAPGAS